MNSLTDSNVDLRHVQGPIEGSSVHVVEAGDPDTSPVVFLHGWPESWYSWQAVMELASERVRAIALDLPGVGGSSGEATDGSKRQLARVVHSLVATMGLEDVTLVGQDVGGMIAYAYLRAYEDLARVVIMDVAVPGLDPWEEVLFNPYIWHFGMHSVPDLPERLVQGRQTEYFDYFYDAISADPQKVTAKARAEYAKAYSTDSALTAGFNWYRTFQQAAAQNSETHQQQTTTPLLYIRGEQEGGDINAYVSGFRDAGVARVEQAIVPGAGHFTQEEAPETTWQLIADFIGL